MLGVEGSPPGGLEGTPEFIIISSSSSSSWWPRFREREASGGGEDWGSGQGEDMAYVLCSAGGRNWVSNGLYRIESRVAGGNCICVARQLWLGEVEVVW